MKKIFIFLLICGAFTSFSSAQVADSLMRQAKLSYQNFEFDAAISYSETAMSLTQDKSLYVDLLSLIGISYYNLWKEDSSKIYFSKIFEIDSTYRLDATTVSPKIVSFFNEQHNLFLLKKRSANIVFRQPAELLPGTEIQSATTTQTLPTINKMAFLHSALFPGLGQLTQGTETKGWAFFSAGLITLGSSIYFTIDSNSKAKKYHTATSQSNIDYTYSKYNTAYQLKNASISLYIGTWLVNLYDIFFN